MDMRMVRRTIKALRVASEKMREMDVTYPAGRIGSRSAWEWAAFKLENSAEYMEAMIENGYWTEETCSLVWPSPVLGTPLAGKQEG